MVGHLEFGVVDTVELPQHLDEVGLSAHEMPGRERCGGFQGGPAEMLHVKYLLSLDQLFVELDKRESGWHHGMLNIEEAVIPRLDLGRCRVPALGSWVRSIDADGHDLRDVQAPLPNCLESLSIPVGIGDQIDGHADAKGSGTFQRFEVFPQRDALAMHPE